MEIDLFEHKVITLMRENERGREHFREKESSAHPIMFGEQPPLLMFFYTFQNYIKLPNLCGIYRPVHHRLL